MREPSHDAASDFSRTSSIGFLLRRTKWDEVPQLFNILKGEMSFIGPRPLLPEYLSIYPISVRKRHTTRPGITGLAQVHGASSLAWKNRFKLDLIYLDNISFTLDAWILIKTLLQLVMIKDCPSIGRYEGR